jgi:hypothetical protein
MPDSRSRTTSKCSTTAAGCTPPWATEHHLKHSPNSNQWQPPPDQQPRNCPESLTHLSSRRAPRCCSRPHSSSTGSGIHRSCAVNRAIKDGVLVVRLICREVLSPPSAARTRTTSRDPRRADPEPATDARSARPSSSEPCGRLRGPRPSPGRRPGPRRGNGKFSASLRCWGLICLSVFAVG